MSAYSVYLAGKPNMVSYPEEGKKSGDPQPLL